MKQWIKIKELKKEKAYNQIFLKESNKLPTKADSIDFYKTHGLEDYILHEGDNIKLLDIPYKEKKRIVDERISQN